MILQRLYEYAQQNGLLEDLSFQQVPVRWLVVLDKRGSLLRLAEQNSGAAKAPARRDPGPLMSVPRREKRSGKSPAANFLADNAAFVLGLDFKDPSKPVPVPEYRERFAALIAAAARATGDEALAAAQRFYASDLKKLAWHAAFKNAAISPADTFTLAVRLGDAVEVLADRPRVREWWTQRCEAPEEQSQIRTTCLVTGREALAERLHPSIRGIYGGQPTGTSLVSFNLAAFESYGLMQSENAPVCREAAWGYCEALNRLLRRGQPADRRSIVLPGGVTVVIFTGQPSGADGAALAIQALDPQMDDLFMRDDSYTWRAVEALYGAPWHPQYSPLQDETSIYTLVLSANAARIMVRDWFEGRVSDVAASLKQYFDDLAIFDTFAQQIRRAFPLKTPSKPKKAEAGEERGAGETMKAPPGLLDALRGKGEQTDVAPDVARHVVMAALNRALPLPLQLLEVAVRRIRAEAAASDYGAVSVPRAALIKACLNRELRRPAGALRARWRALDPAFKEVNPIMDENCRIPAYLLGRMMAVLEQAQAKAIPEANATIVDRAYGAASATPATVLPRLLRGVRHHLSKVKSDSPGVAVTYEKLLDDISSKFPDPASAFPSALPLYEQGLFALGYYQQRAELFRKRSE